MSKLLSLFQFIINRLRVQSKRHGVVLRGWRGVSINLLWLALALCLLPTAPSAAARAHDPLVTAAQSNIATLDQFFGETWTSTQGLPHNTINGISQTPDGYLWLATWEGLTRFNGREFYVYGRGGEPGLPDAGTRAVRLDVDGNLLVAGARGGFAALVQGVWQSYLPIDTQINDIVRDNQGQLWLATEGQGVARIDVQGQRQQWRQADGLPADVVYSIWLDGQQQVWVGTGKGLAVWSPVTRQWQSQFAGLPQTTILEILFDAQGRLWLGTEQGVYLQAERGAAFSQPLPQLADVAVASMIADRQGRIWLGSVNDGLFMYADSQLFHYHTQQGLPNDRVLALYEDQEASIWVGTNTGLHRLRSALFSSVTERHGLIGNYVRSVLPINDEQVLIGTSAGVALLTGRQLSTPPVPEQVQRESILSLARQSQTWYFGSYSQGLYISQAERLLSHWHKGNGLLSNEVRAILPSEQGVWVGSAQGLNLIQDQNIQSFEVAQGLPHPFVVALAQDNQQRLWVGTGKGLAVFAQGQFHNFAIEQYEQAQYVFGFYYQAALDVMWVCTDRGLLRIADGQTQLFGRARGMPFDKVFQLAQDQHGDYWLSSNRGMLRIKAATMAQAIDNPKLPLNVEIFTESDGLASAQANGGSNPAMSQDRQGRLYIATAKGVAILNPQFEQRVSQFQPPVWIDGVTLGSQAQFLQGQYEFPAGDQRIELSYAGLGFVNTKRLLYRTFLQGFDEQWIERGNQTSVEYAGLGPGTYTFKVLAAYPNGNWSEKPATVTFSIAPHFWQRPIFWWLQLVLVLMTGVGLWKWRTATLVRAEQRLRIEVAEKEAELATKEERLAAAAQEKTALLSKLRRQAFEFEMQAREDELTELANKRAFDETLRKEMVKAQRYQLPLCLAFIDLDHFKAVNDGWSYSVGDKTLQAVAVLIAKLAPASSRQARWGGDKFAVLSVDLPLAEFTGQLQQLKQAIAELNTSHFAPGLAVTTSIGVAQFTEDMSYDIFVGNADNALYRAKQQGRDRVVSFTLS